MTMTNKERLQVVQCSINIFIEGVRMKKWLEKLKPYDYFIQIPPAKITEIAKEIDEDIEGMMKRATPLTFGKYKGKTIEDVMEIDPEYIAGTEILFCPICQKTTTFDVFRDEFSDYSIELKKQVKFKHITKKCTVCGAKQSYNEKFDKTSWSIGNCSICGNECVWSGATVRTDNGEIVCKTCSDKGEPQDVVLREVRHTLHEDGGLEFDLNLTGTSEIYKYNGHVIWLDNEGTPSSVWIENGHTAFKLRNNEKDLTLIELLDTMETLVAENKFRCSNCGQDFSKPPAGRPLFAGINCEECWEKHKQHLNNQREKGHICRLCGQPYGACCC